jgi:hypothetical protein
MTANVENLFQKIQKMKPKRRRDAMSICLDIISLRPGDFAANTSNTSQPAASFCQNQKPWNSPAKWGLPEIVCIH